MPCQPLFQGLKIKASWPGLCRQRGGGTASLGLKGIWLANEASPTPQSVWPGVPGQQHVPPPAKEGMSWQGQGAPLLTKSPQHPGANEGGMSSPVLSFAHHPFTQE